LSLSKIQTYFGFKDGKLVTILQSVNSDLTKAVDCTYFISEPQGADKQIKKWKEEILESKYL
jgi:hypothetical protein